MNHRSFLSRTIELLFILILFNSVQLFAQKSYSCYYREYCEWSEDSLKYINCSGYEEPSLFVLNAEQTMFVHTIESMKSAYYVSDKKYDATTDVWTYTVTSDVGNKYIYEMDPTNKEVRATYVRDGKTMLVRFLIKAIF